MASSSGQQDIISDVEFKNKQNRYAESLGRPIFYFKVRRPNPQWTEGATAPPGDLRYVPKEHTGWMTYKMREMEKLRAWIAEKTDFNIVLAGLPNVKMYKHIMENKLEVVDWELPADLDHSDGGQRICHHHIERLDMFRDKLSVGLKRALEIHATNNGLRNQFEAEFNGIIYDRDTGI